ncbi:hypothetical protein [Actinoallomurus iriomotensis]|uniref:Uncharacterized protein n=1 Tax=Actinoallomurus iriomotensis TaxID=478107 RepID=A0A9W6VRM0_9ACTN|nr:hypothetical protein [Actinoallomurus iriomotensis]GLY76642.1 hypothetical protein Airi01_049090 [Actinoallomurus iriomotensis]
MPDLASSDFWLGMIGGLLLNLLASEVYDRSPRLARRVARRSARFRFFHPGKAQTYGEEYAGRIDRMSPGNLGKLVVGFGFWLDAVLARAGMAGYTPFSRADNVARYLEDAARYAQRVTRGIGGARVRVDAVDPDAMTRFAAELRRTADLALDLAGCIDDTDPQDCEPRVGELLRAITEFQDRLHAEDLATRTLVAANPRSGVSRSVGEDRQLTVSLRAARHHAEELAQEVASAH